LKQIFAYSIYWKANEGILLYPLTDAQTNLKGKYHKEHSAQHGCTLAFINVLNEEGKLNKKIGEEVLALLEEEVTINENF
jgi:hypothetical protein